MRLDLMVIALFLLGIVVRGTAQEKKTVEKELTETQQMLEESLIEAALLWRRDIQTKGGLRHRSLNRGELLSLATDSDRSAVTGRSIFAIRLAMETWNGDPYYHILHHELSMLLGERREDDEGRVQDPIFALGFEASGGSGEHFEATWILEISDTDLRCIRRDDDTRTYVSKPLAKATLNKWKQLRANVEKNITRSQLLGDVSIDSGVTIVSAFGERYSALYAYGRGQDDRTVKDLCKLINEIANTKAKEVR